MSENPYGLNQTKRFTSPSAERALYTRQQTHTDAQFVELIDYMGGDETVVRAATAGHGTGIFPENPSTEDFLVHLAAKRIKMPFRSVQLKFRMQSSIMDALHIVYEKRASVNEYSGRYSIMIDSAFVPTAEFLAARIRGKSLEAAQDAAKQLADVLQQERTINYGTYSGLVGKDVDLARELARAPLEINNDTTFIWKIDLESLMGFIKEKREQLPAMHTLMPYLNILEQCARAVAPKASVALQYGQKILDLHYPRDAAVIDATPLPSHWGSSETRRVTVPQLEELLFVKQPYLEGGVQAVDYMGDDRGPVESARISYGTGTARTQEDKHLTKYLLRHAHTTPFECVELAVEGNTPIFVDPRQGARHRTLDDDCFMGETLVGNKFYIPPAHEMKHQDRKNRQGRGSELDDELKDTVVKQFQDRYAAELNLCTKLEDAGLPGYVSRGVKGVGFHTFRWRTGDLKNWLDFLRLRWDAHAQKEIRDYAEIIARFVQAQSPTAFEAFLDYRKNAVNLSAKEITLMNSLVKEIDPEDPTFYRAHGLVDSKEKLTREGEEFKAKLKKILAAKGPQ